MIGVYCVVLSFLLLKLQKLFHRIEKCEMPIVGHASCVVNPLSVLDVAAVIAHVIDNRAYFARKEVCFGKLKKFFSFLFLEFFFCLHVSLSD